MADADDDNNTVLVPERLSVKDLRDWLSQFGQANRQHFEKGRLLEEKQKSIQSRIQSLEDALGPTSPSTVSSQTSHHDDQGMPLEGRTWESPPKRQQQQQRKQHPPPPSASRSGRETVVNVPSMRDYDTEQRTSPPKAPSSTKPDKQQQEQQPSPNSVRTTMKAPISTSKPQSELPDRKTWNTGEAWTRETWNHHVKMGQYWSTSSTSADPVVGDQVKTGSVSSNESSSATTTTTTITTTATKPASSPKSSVSPTSKVYRFEAVVRPRGTGTRRHEAKLLQLPTPQPRKIPTIAAASPWDDEWVDDFSEPDFPTTSTSTSSKCGGTTTTVLRTRIVGKVEEGQEEWHETDWTKTADPNDDHVMDDDDCDDDYDDYDDQSLLESISVGTGRYTEPGRRGRKKNRFPFWLCQKPKDHDNDDDDIATPTAEAVYTSPPRPPTHLYQANLFPNGVLTKSTLDLLCRNDNNQDNTTTAAAAVSKGPARQDGVPATSSPKNQRHRDSNSSNSTTTSSEAPAILPGAVHDQLKVVLATNANTQKDNKKVSSAIQQFGGGRKSEGGRRSKSCSTSHRRPRCRRSSTTMSTVEQRRRQLQQALEKDRPVSHVKRIQWHVCPTTGLYKKKIVVEPKQET